MSRDAAWFGWSILLALSLALHPSLGSAATITVNSTLQVVNPGPDGNGDGLCQLSEAIRAANTDLPVDGCAAGAGADTIVLPSDAYVLSAVDSTGPLSQSVGLPVITSDITIRGEGPGTVSLQRDTASGVPAFSFLAVDVSGSLTLDSLNFFTGGGVAKGGAVLNLGKLVVKNCNFGSNSASVAGGAIYGSATITGSVFNSNGAQKGGALACAETDCVISVSGSTFENNFVSDCCVSGEGGAIQGMRLEVTGSYFRYNSADGSGGALSAGSHSFVRDSYFNGNYASWRAGAITGQFDISGSTFAYNYAYITGAVHTFASTVTNTTVHSNGATISCGGVESGGGVTFNNVTIARNYAGEQDYDYDIYGSTGGLCAGTHDGVGDRIRNSVLAGNFALDSNTYDWVGWDCTVDPATVSDGHNLIQVDCSWPAATGDQLGIDPLLQDLRQNAGRTAGAQPVVIPTAAPLAGSPALDAGDPMAPGSGGTTCEATDERGVTRPLGSACDIGAFEGIYQPSADLSVTVTDTVDPVPVGHLFRYVAAILNNGPDTAETITASLSLPSGVSLNAYSGGCTSSADVITCTRTNLAPGYAFYVWADVIPLNPGSLSAGATATSATPDPQDANNAGSAATTVLPIFLLSVSRSGAGSGTMSSSPAGILCGLTCSAAFTSGTVVTVTALPASGSVFTGWSGDCSVNSTCVVTMTGDRNVTADFEPGSMFNLSVTRLGLGTVTSDLTGISCGNVCSASYAQGAVVTLTPSPDSGYIFTGWSGDCSGSGACQLTMNATHSVSATFSLASSRANLSVGLADAADPIPAGGNLSYLVTVVNAGPDAAAAVVLTDTLPAGVTFASAAPPQGSCSANTGGFSCALGSLSAGAAFTFAVTVSVGESGALVNTITVSSATQDPDAADNSDSEQTSALGVTVSPNAPTMTITAGQNATFALTVLPDPGGFSNPVDFTCTLPAQMLYASCGFSPASVTPNSGPATSNLIVHTTGSQLALHRSAAPWLALSFAVPGLLLVSGRRRSRLLVVLSFLLLLAGLAALGGCGGSSALVNPPNPAPRTPAGTYTVNVTATSGSFHRSANVTVTVN